MPSQHAAFQGSVAYVPQEAWVQNGSVVENVCFRQELDLPWLEEVLDACALWPDVSRFPAGLHSPVGEQVRVSGYPVGREGAAPVPSSPLTSGGGRSHGQMGNGRGSETETRAQVEPKQVVSAQQTVVGAE